MQVLVIGSGGREHALVWKLAQSRQVDKIFAAPGNDGMGNLIERVPIAVDDIDGLVDWALAHEIDLTVVGPEVPLTLGIVDRFMEVGLKIFGPSQRAAQIEGSKAFAKDLMHKYHIPTADYQIFTDPQKAKEYILNQIPPLVIKADGLAAGKGVVIADTLEQAVETIDVMMQEQKWGQAGKTIVVEEFLQGIELSILALTDGMTLIPMTPAHDHKAAYDGDTGPNTGGMGAFSPSPFVEEDFTLEIIREILDPTLHALREEGVIYQGVLYAGLMLTPDGPKVLEFNARFGDPETQVILPRLKTDLAELMLATIEGTLDALDLEWAGEKALTVVLASGGYPGRYEKGKEISGLNSTGQLDGSQEIIFHAGTRKEGEKWVTNGGRVLALTALGETYEMAQKKAYTALEKIQFAGVQYRRDIGNKAIDHK